MALLLACGSAAAAPPPDPLNSPMWEYLAKSLLGADARIAFDSRVKVVFPEIAENQRVFPVAVDARGIEGVRRILIFADLNPIQQAIDYRSEHAAAFIETRIKLDQRTPVRGAVQLADGRWLVSGGWVDAAGGGCSMPPVSRVKGDWAQHLGEVRARAWAQPDGTATLRMSFRHPMDTGLVENISSYFLDEIVLTDSSGARVGTVALQASVAEDPVITLLPQVPAGGTVTVAAQDTGGVRYRAVVPVPRASTPALVLGEAR